MNITINKSLKINLQYASLPYPVPDFIYDGLREHSRNANLYHVQPEKFIKKLAPRYDIPSEFFFLTAGADEAIRMLSLAYGNKTYVFSPAFIGFGERNSLSSEVIFIDSVEDSQFNIVPTTYKDATLFFLANPNNPLGYTPREKIIELIENNTHAIVVIDEVYIDFYNHSVIDLVQKYPNLAVIRSFSKSHSLAGNRIGYVIANPKIIAKISTKTQWANVSALSIGAATIALEHQEYFTSIIKEILDRKDRFYIYLRDKNFTVFSSKINAQLIKFRSEKEAYYFVQFLKQNNIIISHGNGNSNLGLDYTYVRITIGTEEEMAILKNVIEQYIIELNLFSQILLHQ